MPTSLQRLCLICCVCWAVLLPIESQAHRVNLFCWAEGRTIFCEASFPGGKPVHEGTTNARTASGKTVHSGQTNAQGAFSFTVPENCTSDLEVLVQAGMGHRTSWPVKAAEYLSADKEAERAPQPQHEPAATQDTSQDTATTAPQPDTAAMETAVRKAVAAELGPLKKQLAQLQQDRVTLPDIIGGLGYILGLMGIAMYFASKQR